MRDTFTTQPPCADLPTVGSVVTLRDEQTRIIGYSQHKSIENGELFWRVFHCDIALPSEHQYACRETTPEHIFRRHWKKEAL